MTLEARWQAAGAQWRAALAAPVSLAIPVHFRPGGLRHFGAPPPRSEPLRVGGFTGDVRQGASCNCHSITLTPHCHGTHTECVGHLTDATIHVREIAPRGLLPALVLSVPLFAVAATDETTRPPPAAGDRLVTREALATALQALPARDAALPVEALVLRTLPNDERKFTRDYSDGSAAYLTLEAVAWLLERGVRHLVLDLPSVDRSHDEGELAGHRLFFGLPPRGESGAPAPARARCTVTELAYVPRDVHDGAVLLQLTLPELDGDAVPSTPLVYRLEHA